MNGTPHAHDPKVRSDHAGWKIWNVVYGDTHAFLYPWPLCHWIRTPSARAVARATRRAIARHDRGSIRVAKREQRRADALLVAAQEVSDWYMDSQQRMDDLHGDAIREESRAYVRRAIPTPVVFGGVDDRPNVLDYATVFGGVDDRPTVRQVTETVDRLGGMQDNLEEVARQTAINQIRRDQIERERVMRDILRARSVS